MNTQSHRPEDYLTEELASYLARSRRRSARLDAWRKRMLAKAPPAPPRPDLT